MPPLLVLLNWTKLKLVQQMHVRVHQYHLSLSKYLIVYKQDGCNIVVHHEHYTALV